MLKIPPLDALICCMTSQGLSFDPAVRIQTKWANRTFWFGYNKLDSHLGHIILSVCVCVCVCVCVHMCTCVCTCARICSVSMCAHSVCECEQSEWMQLSLACRRTQCPLAHTEMQRSMPIGSHRDAASIDLKRHNSRVQLLFTRVSVKLPF